MTNYINDILDLLDGETPKAKYDSLISLRNRDVNKSQALQIWANADMRNNKMESSILTQQEIQQVQHLSC